MDDVSSNDFYEDDEPIDDVVAAFGDGPHPLTAAPLPAGATLVTAFATFADGPTIRPSWGGLHITRPTSDSLTAV